MARPLSVIQISSWTMSHSHIRDWRSRGQVRVSSRLFPIHAPDPLLEPRHYSTHSPITATMASISEAEEEEGRLEITPDH